MKKIADFSYIIFNKHQFLRFLVVGGINTLFGYGCFAFFIFLGLHYSIAVLLSTICGILFNFKTTGIIVFNSRDNRLIIKFVIVYGITYVCNVSGLKILLSFGLNPYIAGALLIIPMALLSYILNKKLVFNIK